VGVVVVVVIAAGVVACFGGSVNYYLGQPIGWKKLQ
jgi:membrane protein DedA with SNARE-associated domain